jgi:hypothetical protein
MWQILENSISQFYVHVTVHRNKFLFNKTNRRTNFTNLFCQETLHVSGSSSTHHQEFSTVNSALVHVMQVCWQLSSTTRMDVLEFTVENSWWRAEELPETCSVYWQNKFVKLVRLLFLLKNSIASWKWRSTA